MLHIPHKKSCPRGHHCRSSDIQALFCPLVRKYPQPSEPGDPPPPPARPERLRGSEGEPRRVRALLLLLVCSWPAAAQDTCDRQARQILELLRVRDGRHVLLEENVATYLFNLRESVPEASLTSLDALRAWLREREDGYRRRRTFGSNELGRWPAKLYGSLDHPYHDAEVGRHTRRVLRAFRLQCQNLSLNRPHYPRRFFAFGAFAQGRMTPQSDLDYFFNDPGGERASKQYVVPGLCRGLAFDEASFAEREQRYLAGELKVMWGGPVADLGRHQPWLALRKLVWGRLRSRGLLLHEDGAGDWVVQRVGYPARTYEDPSSEEERSRPI